MRLACDELSCRRGIWGFVTSARSLVPSCASMADRPSSNIAIDRVFAGIGLEYFRLGALASRLRAPSPTATDARRTLDVYRPANVAQNAPVVVFFYGGSWQTGSKAFYKFVGTALARRGYLTIVPDYRLYPEVRYPEFLDDGAHAVRWAPATMPRVWAVIRRNSLLWGIRQAAYIAAMLALDRRWFG